jgi:hypothetical protein
MSWKPSKESLALAVASIAAVTSLGTAVLATWSAHSLERERWEQTQRNEAAKERNLAIAAFAKNVASCGQETSWFLSKSVNAPEQFSADDIAAYDAAIKPFMSEMVSSLFFVAAHDKGAYEALRPLSQQFYELDGATTAAATTFEKSRTAGLQQFQQLAERHEAWLAKLPSTIATVIAQQETE